MLPVELIYNTPGCSGLAEKERGKRERGKRAKESGKEEPREQWVLVVGGIFAVTQGKRERK